MGLFIKCDVSAGSNIRSTITKMKRLAQITGVYTEADFNGVALIIHHSTDIDSAVWLCNCRIEITDNFGITKDRENFDFEFFWAVHHHMFELYQRCGYKIWLGK